MRDEHYTVLKTEGHKLQAFIKYLLKNEDKEIWWHIFSIMQCCIYNPNTIKKRMKGCIIPFPVKNDFRIAKDYKSINLTNIDAKIFYALLLNCIWAEVDEVLRKQQKSFWRNWSTTSQILTIKSSMNTSKKSQVSNLVYRFLQDLWFHTQSKDGANTSSKQFSKRNCYCYNDALQRHKGYHQMMILTPMTMSLESCKEIHWNNFNSKSVSITYYLFQ